MSEARDIVRCSNEAKQDFFKYHELRTYRTDTIFTPGVRTDGDKKLNVVWIRTDGDKQQIQNNYMYHENIKKL